MPRPRPLASEQLGRAFSVAEALRCGVPASRLRRGDLISPFRGVRLAIADDGWQPRCAAYATRMPATVVFSHVTAARLWLMPLPQHHREDERMHVTAVAARAPRGRGVVGHTTTRNPPTETIGALRATSPARTWADLSTVLTVDELVIIGDALVGLPVSISTCSELAQAVHEHAGRRGSAALHEAMPLIRVGSRSPRESRARLAIVRAGLPEPEVNGEIVLPRRIVHGDLVFRSWRVVVEYEGDQHRTDAWQWAHDLERYNDLAEAGWLLIRASRFLPDADLASRARRALRVRGWTG
ncbi:hypothetical protein [Microbacterium sp. P02]|uniref:hypothetical protein n=1 Tax=Microbacterium sp. P02 TaxID=3366260 RepID=UPI00366F8362